MTPAGTVAESGRSISGDAMTRKCRPYWRWPDQWTRPGVETLVFAIAVRAVLDGEDEDGRWIRHVRAVAFDDVGSTRRGMARAVNKW